MNHLKQAKFWIETLCELFDVDPKDANVKVTVNMKDGSKRPLETINLAECLQEYKADLVCVDRALLEAAVNELAEWKVAKGGDDQVYSNLKAILTD